MDADKVLRWAGLTQKYIEMIHNEYGDCAINKLVDDAWSIKLFSHDVHGKVNPKKLEHILKYKLENIKK